MSALHVLLPLTVIPNYIFTLISTIRTQIGKDHATPPISVRGRVWESPGKTWPDWCHAAASRGSYVCSRARGHGASGLQGSERIRCVIGYRQRRQKKEIRIACRTPGRVVVPALHAAMPRACAYVPGLNADSCTHRFDTTNVASVSALRSSL